MRPQKRNRYYGAQQQGAFEVTEHDPVATGTDDVVIRVSSGAVITGKVVGPHGRPIPAAMVIALTKKKKKGRGAVTAMTNARGEFKLKGVGKDPVEILAGASGHLPASMDAQPEQSGVVIDLEKGGSIEGDVRKADGSPMANHWVSVTPTDPAINKKLASWRNRGANSVLQIAGGQYGRTDGKGRFELKGMHPGEYMVRIWGQDGVLPPTKVQTGETGIRLQLEPGYTVTGRIVDEEGKPVLDKKEQGPYISARQGTQWYGGVRADAKGHFEIKNLPGGALKLQAWVSGYQNFTVETTAGARDVQVVMKKVKPAPKPKPAQKPPG